MERRRTNPAGWTVFCLLAVLLAGCSNKAIGEPELRVSDADGMGPMIAGCRNVSAAARVESFTTTSYRTTWGSAWSEGAAQGVSEGLEGEVDLGSFFSGIAKGHVPKGVTLTTQVVQPRPFCRTFDTSRPRVLRAVASALRDLKAVGYKVVARDGAGGFFQTSYVARQLPPFLGIGKKSPAKWYDAFQISVRKVPGGGTAVVVNRPIFISRDGKVYNQARSVGHLETYVLTRIADAL